MITYQEKPEGVAVFLDKKRTGTIKQVMGGWAYFPIGKKMSGEVFPSIAKVKQSLEAE